MAIIRGEKPETGYYILDNRIVDDERLSLQAMGLLVFFLTRPDNWQVSETHIRNRFGIGRDKCRALLDELVRCGYATKEQERVKTGKFAKNDWLISEIPFTENPSTDEPSTEIPSTESEAPSEQPFTGNTEAAEPFTGLPSTAEPFTANPTLNNYLIKTNTDFKQLHTLDFADWPDFPTRQTMLDWLDVRKSKKAKVTQTVVNHIARELVILVARGVTAETAFVVATVGNWQGFRAEWILNRLNGGGGYENPSGKTRDRSLQTDLADRSWAN